MYLNQLQIESISKLLADLAKILFASIIVGFFIPSSSSNVSLIAFISGLVTFVGFFTLSIVLLKTSPAKT